MKKQREFKVSFICEYDSPMFDEMSILFFFLVSNKMSIICWSYLSTKIWA